MPSQPSQANPSKIFISYRRSDSAAHAGRLSDQLTAHFGSQIIFIDVESIEPGRDFVEALEEAVSSCKVLLAVIGQQWLTCANERGRRLDDPNDFVRLEIAAALKRGVRVIPVLVQGATIPREQDLPDDIAPLARKQAWYVSDIRWKQDVGKLIEKIAGDIPGSVNRPAPAPPSAPRAGGKKVPIKPLMALASLFIITAIYVYRDRLFTRRPEQQPQPCRKSAGGETRYYEAEAAHLAGGARRDTQHPGFSEYGFVSGYGVEALASATPGADSPSTTFWVDAPSDGQYQVALCYGNGNDAPKTLTIYVNDERVKLTVLPNAARWNIWRTQAETLPLRAGRNAISYRKSEYGDGEVNLDFIGVAGEPSISAPTQTATATPTPPPSKPPPAPKSRVRGSKTPRPKGTPCSAENRLLGKC